jgi:hypothetical protein
LKTTAAVALMVEHSTKDHKIKDSNTDITWVWEKMTKKNKKQIKRLKLKKAFSCSLRLLLLLTHTTAA